jgi:uncharacterized protein with NRDE domain
LAWWEDTEILGGRDGVAGGTWLASSRDGKVAFLTNVRELISLPNAKTRGDLVVRFLQSSKSCMEFAKEIVLEADEYNGFNLVVVDLCSMVMVHVTNRPLHNRNNLITEVSPGIHVLSNASLDSPWLKAERLRQSFKNVLDTYGDDEIPIKEVAEKLMRNTVKDDENMLPQIYPAEWEYKLSSIFIEAETPKGAYGTRSISTLAAKSSGEVSFYENHLENKCWIDQTVTYQIDKSVTK